jgi:hypothetical protein
VMVQLLSLSKRRQSAILRIWIYLPAVVMCWSQTNLTV